MSMIMLSTSHYIFLPSWNVKCRFYANPVYARYVFITIEIDIKISAALNIFKKKEKKKQCKRNEKKNEC